MLVLMGSRLSTQGLDGTQYDFLGIPGKVYSILAYSGHSFSYSLISRFGHAYTTGISLTEEGSLVSYKQKVYLRSDSRENYVCLYVLSHNSLLSYRELGCRLLSFL